MSGQRSMLTAVPAKGAADGDVTFVIIPPAAHQRHTWLP